MSVEQLILEFDHALRTVFSMARSQRPMPGAGLPEAGMSEQERAHAGRLMRVNQAGMKLAAKVMTETAYRV